MNKQSRKEMVKGILAVAVGLLVVLMPYSLFIGWNILTLSLFWLVIVPCIALYLPTKASRSKNHLIESLIGLAIFYTFMVFMIYDHYKSDYFLVMMFSYVINLAAVSVISLTRKGGTQTMLTQK